MVPFSTDARGRFVSHVLSARASPSGRKRVPRDAPVTPHTALNGQQLFFNVTVFGKELHLRLRANRRLVAPGAFVQWQEDFEEQAKERMLGDCVFTGDVTDMPKASVAISNCDGLLALRLLNNNKAGESHAAKMRIVSNGVQPYIVQTGVDTDGETQEEVTTFRRF
ncbi:A disintegrin and metalloproteinase with thrombospondin motifs 14 [Anabarilius grahami]|uniref:A disintegrin and metalloproteinase with thrombospondin motifs 14 n=1 Tax=Anabarilius grahami TaxID=495550 RepID=A0A3N0XP16_ANAGA|nr:A disintegrin and metalloproteinase with thrombospondin motifs 14 [Anabarilius grahami]